MIEYKGYTGVFEFDRDLDLFAGHVVDLGDEIYFEGDSVVGLTESMKRAVDHYVKVCKARGDEPEKPFSGKLNVRLGSDLHRAIAVAAAANRESINSWISRVAEAAVKNEGAPGPTSRRPPALRRKRESSRQKPA